MNNIFDLIEKNSSKDVAIVDNCEKITYGELVQFCKRKYDCFSNLKKGDIVVIYAKKSAKYVSLMIAMIYRGVVYVPLDEHTPIERVQLISKKVNAKYVFVDQINDIENEIVINDCFNSESELITCLSDEIVVDQNDLVYMICTSGSTGEPKLVMIEQHSLLNLVGSLNKRIYSNIKSDGQLRVAVVASFSFDASVKQIFCALSLGHALFICGDKDKMLGRRFLSFIQEKKINVIDCTPTLLSSTYVDKMRSENKCLKTIILGGEKLLQKHIEESRELFGEEIQLVNVYGPTECCVDATCFLVPKDYKCIEQEEIPIGTPLDNVVLELNEQSELIIKGTCVGRGYFNTDNQGGFFYDERGTKSYKTGDICYKKDGEYYHVGRIDDQVKINGFRIEPSIIDYELTNVEGVLFSISLAIQIGNRTIICTALKSIKDEKTFLSYLKKHIPDYCLPKFFIYLEDDIKLTKNGKIDKEYYRQMFYDYLQQYYKQL